MHATRWGLGGHDTPWQLGPTWVLRALGHRRLPGLAWWSKRQCYEHVTKSGRGATSHPSRPHPSPSPSPRFALQFGWPAPTEVQRKRGGEGGRAGGRGGGRAGGRRAGRRLYCRVVTHCEEHHVGFEPGHRDARTAPPARCHRRWAGQLHRGDAPHGGPARRPLRTGRRRPVVGPRTLTHGGHRHRHPGRPRRTPTPTNSSPRSRHGPTAPTSWRS